MPVDADAARLPSEADPDRVAAAAQTHGFAIVERLIEPERMEQFKVELAAAFAAVQPEAATNRTKRIHSRTLAVSPTYGALVIHPLVLAVCDRILGPHCVRYQLSSIQGVQVWPGAAPQNLHRDDAIFRQPRPRPEMELNLMWAADDFTEENGATRLVPGSHIWDDSRKPAPADPVIAATMPRGSVLIWLGSTWHGAGANRSQSPRMGAYVGYSLGWLRQEEILYLALPPDVARSFPEPLQRLIGYELKGTMTLGWLDGQDPRVTLGFDAPASGPPAARY